LRGDVWGRHSYSKARLICGWGSGRGVPPLATSQGLVECCNTPLSRVRSGQNQYPLFSPVVSFENLVTNNRSVFVSTFPFKFRSVQTTKTPLVTALHRTDEKLLGIPKIHLHSCSYQAMQVLTFDKNCQNAASKFTDLNVIVPFFWEGGKAPRPPY